MPRLDHVGQLVVGPRVGLEQAVERGVDVILGTMPEQAIDGLQLGILFNQGQVCCAGSRIFVQKGIYDKFVTELAERFNRVKVGLPWLEDTQMGAQIDGRQVGFSIGVNAEEVTEIALRLGAWNSTRFDGGGSSAMWATRTSGWITSRQATQRLC